MGRSRYKIHEPTYPHFITCTIVHWIPIFRKKEREKMGDSRHQNETFLTPTLIPFSQKIYVSVPFFL